MTWVKLPDDFLEDPRALDLEPAVVLAYLRALAWSNRWARDGRIPPAMGHDEWVTAGLATSTDSGYQLDWLLEHQPTADEIGERRQYQAKLQRRRRRHLAGDHRECDPSRCRALASRDESPHESSSDTRPLDPTRPDPTRKEGRRGGENGRATSRAAGAGRRRGGSARPRKVPWQINDAIQEVCGLSAHLSPEDYGALFTQLGSGDEVKRAILQARNPRQMVPLPQLLGRLLRAEQSA